MPALTPVLKILLAILLLSPAPIRADAISDQRDSFKSSYQPSTPVCTGSTFWVPFRTPDRRDLTTIAQTSKFGAARRSYIRGHIHTGSDLIPQAGSPSTVFPIACGTVCSIHLAQPHQTVVIQHKLSDGTTLFSSYKHLARIDVKPGQQVSHKTPLGRMYTRAEAKAQKGPYDHLHLEIRKKFDDYGVASWATMTRKALKQRFYDPWKFLKRKLER